MMNQLQFFQTTHTHLVDTCWYQNLYPLNTLNTKIININDAMIKQRYVVFGRGQLKVVYLVDMEDM